MKIEFYNVGGACFVLKIDDRIKIGCDPVLEPEGSVYDFKIFKSKRIKPPLYDDALFSNMHLWLITHGHEDHIDHTGVSKIDPASKIVLQKSAKGFFSGRQFKDTTMLNWHNSIALSFEGYTINVKAIPAFHASNLFMRALVGKVNGYLLTISNGSEKKVVYATSDTVYHKKVMESLLNRNIDVMIANLGEVQPKMFGGPLTMNIDMLKTFIRNLKPHAVIPIHFDDFSHYNTNAKSIVKNDFRIYDPGKWFTLEL